MIPGEYILKQEKIKANTNKKTIHLEVTNKGDRPVQIGSHYHFFEINKEIDFEREKAIGMRLNIPAGTAIRFEPGEAKDVELVSISGSKSIYGFNNLIDGNIDSIKPSEIKKRLNKFLNK